MIFGVRIDEVRKEWMVTPPALMAAMPVDATTTARFAVVDVSCRRKVVFPVPARPVRNTLHDVFSISLRASPDFVT